MRFVPDGVSRTLARQALLSKKHSPAILFGAGVAGAIGSTVLACKATLKLEEVLDKAEGDLEIAKTLVHHEYSELDRASDVRLIYIRSAVEVGKLYAPAIGLGVLSIAALTQSHNILTKRNAALTAAYAAIERGFSEYRSRVVERYGSAVDEEFRYGNQKVEIIDEETGRKKSVVRHNTTDASIYARFFDEYSTYWSVQPEYNRLFLKCQQNHANDLLRARGHVFLNEVYDSLGIARSKAGSVVGWILTKDQQGDNYIDFGIFDDARTDAIRDFVNGREASILLDFNVDGVIFDKIEQTEDLSWQLGR